MLESVPVRLTGRTEVTRIRLRPSQKVLLTDCSSSVSLPNSARVLHMHTLGIEHHTNKESSESHFKSKEMWKKWPISLPVHLKTAHKSAINYSSHNHHSSRGIHEDREVLWAPKD